MKAADHLHKAGRIEFSRGARLDDRDDCELIIWSCIHGGAHLLNAALHAAGLTDEGRDFIRSDKLDPGLQLTDQLSLLVRSLRDVEALGGRFVRGGEIADLATVRFCIDSYNAARAVAEQLVGQRS